MQPDLGRGRPAPSSVGRVTRSGLPLLDHYGPAKGKSEQPGQFPFTRGRKAGAQAQGGWIQRELSGEGDGKRSNEQIRYLLEHGQNGIDVIGDAPTQSMLDADHPLALAAVGTQGVSLCRKQDYLDLFKDVPFATTSISSSAPAIMALSGLVLAAREAKFPLEKLRGSVLQGPLYTEDCSYATHLPVAFRVRLTLDCMEYCARHMPKFHSYVEDTYFFSESGLYPIEEMALGFLQLRYLTRQLIARGVPVDSFAPRIALLVNCGMDFFEEIAKVRATRRTFAKMMRNEFGAEDERSLSVAISSHTSGLSLTAQQPANNIVRGALQALSLVLGGVQALEISAFDEAYRTPSEEAHLVGLRTQQIIDIESGAARVADPLGGSYFIEALTDDMERGISAKLRELELLGDPTALAEMGYFRGVFHEAMERGQRLVESGELPIVGVNLLQVSEEQDTLLKEVTTRKISTWRQQSETIAAFKRERDIGAAALALQAIANAVRSGGNLVPAVIEALDQSATVGEIVTAMRRALDMSPDAFDSPLP
jgi:methylmalonyl-CoA mutase, N-terminal domain